MCVSSPCILEPETGFPGYFEITSSNPFVVHNLLKAFRIACWTDHLMEMTESSPVTVSTQFTAAIPLRLEQGTIEVCSSPLQWQLSCGTVLVVIGPHQRYCCRQYSFCKHLEL